MMREDVRITPSGWNLDSAQDIDLSKTCISRHRVDLRLGRHVPDRRDQRRRRFGVSIQHRLEFGTGWNQPVVETVPYAPP